MCGQASDGPRSATWRRVYVPGSKKTVVERDIDLLTQDELKMHATAAAPAMKEGLQIWIDHHQCFSRRPRQGDRNILDARWVANRRWVKKDDVSTQRVRIIRQLMTLRGLNVVEAECLITYVGTSSHMPEKGAASEAVPTSTKLALRAPMSARNSGQLHVESCDFAAAASNNGRRCLRGCRF